MRHVYRADDDVSFRKEFWDLFRSTLCAYKDLEKLKIIVGDPSGTEVLFQTLGVHKHWSDVAMTSHATTLTISLRFRTGESLVVKMSSFPIMLVNLLNYFETVELIIPLSITFESNRTLQRFRDMAKMWPFKQEIIWKGDGIWARRIRKNISDCSGL